MEPLHTDPLLTNEPPKPRTTANAESLKMGLMMGVLLIVYSLVLHFAGLITNRGFGWIMYALIFLGIFLGVKNYRDNVWRGMISFGSAFGMGFRIILYAGLLSAAFSYIYYATFGSETLITMRETMEQELLKADMSESQTEQMMGMYDRWLLKPAMLAVSSFIGMLIIGSVISLIVAAILKRQPEQLEPPMP